MDGSKHVLQAASCAKGNIYHSRFQCVDLPFTNGKHSGYELDDLPLMLGGAIFAWFASPLWEVVGTSFGLKLQDEREFREIVLGAGGG